MGKYILLKVYCSKRHKMSHFIKTVLVFYISLFFTFSILKKVIYFTYTIEDKRLINQTILTISQYIYNYIYWYKNRPSPLVICVSNPISFNSKAYG